MTIRRKIIGDSKVEALLVNLQTKPGDVHDCRDRLAQCEFMLSTFKGIENAKEKIAEIEAEIDFEVLNETTEDGKKKYTNEAQRNSAALALKAKLQSYIAAKNELIKAEREKANLTLDMAKTKNQLDYHVNMMFSLGHMADVVAGLSVEDTTNVRLESISKVAGILRDTADNARIAAEELENANG